MWNLGKVSRVLGLLGIRTEKIRGNRIDICCPLAAWRHGKGVDTHPSCTIFVSDGFAGYHCMSCGAKGPLLRLVWDIQIKRNRACPPAMADAYDLWSEEEDWRPTRASLDYRVGGPEIGNAIQRTFARRSSLDAGNPMTDQLTLDGGVQRVVKQPKPYTPPDDAMVAKMVMRTMPEYAHERGITMRTYKEWGLGHDEMNRRLVFPVRRQNGVLVGLSARTYWDKDFCFRCGAMRVDELGRMARVCDRCHQNFSKYYHTPGMPKKEVLFGAHMYKPGTPVVLVEGPLDAINLYGLGVRSPMATLGAAPAPAQLQLAASMSTTVYAMGDGDEAGRNMNRIIVDYFSNTGTTVIPIPLKDSFDPGMLTREDLLLLDLPVDKTC
jgi:hypothetical protein